MEITVAIIGLVGTLLAVLLPIILKRWNISFQVIPTRFVFKRLLIHVTISRWRPCSSIAGPFEKSKTIIFAGLKQVFDLWDESTVFVEWIPRRKLPSGWKNLHLTSGIFTFSPIYPPLLEMDEHRYRVSCGNTLHFSLPISTSNPILYSTHRFNAFQNNQQDFSIILSGQRIQTVSLSFDFTGALAQSAFLQFPTALVTEDVSDTTGTQIPLLTCNGRTWYLHYQPGKKDHRLRVTWRMTDAVTSDAPRYVFGYGSLLSEKSRNKTIGNIGSQREVIPAVLNGFTKTWSAHIPNRKNYKNDDSKAPTFISAMNLEPSPEKQAHGVLIKISREEIEALDQREWVYVRCDVTDDITPLNDFSLPPNARVFTYISLSDRKLNKEGNSFGIRQDYVNLILNACRAIDSELPVNFRKYEQEVEKSLEVYKNPNIQRLVTKATPDRRYTEDEETQ